MKVFISWSGERSRAVAEILRVWLPDVINFIEPWVSSEDIEKGARWGADLVQQLAATDIGIICLTPENINAPWIHFEAGALSKALDKSRVCVYLLQLRPSDLAGPLVQFQATEATQLDTLRLLRTLNSALGQNMRSDDQLQRAFEKWWPELQKKLLKIPNDLNMKPLRADREVLEEMLDLLRDQAKRSAAFSPSKRYLPDAASLLEGEDLELFGKNLSSSAVTDDEESSDWVIEAEDRRYSSPLDGLWAYRWNGSGVDDAWKYGSANLVHRREFLVAICSDQGSLLGPYLLVAREVSAGRFVGRYCSLKEPRDSTPWGGIIIDDARINGRWGWGRWDFRRYK
jgi:TIR domain-containing protein